MAQTQKGESLLQRPLYVFDLPEELLATLTLKDQPERPLQETRPQIPALANAPSEKSDADDSGPAKATSCSLCGLSFASLADQRSHVRSDLHAYNLKQKIKGAKPVGETEFEKLIGDLDESLSGSESSESEDDQDEGDGNRPKDSTLSALLKKQAKITDPEFDEFASRTKQRGPGKPPLLWFTSPSIPDNMSLGVYRALFSNAEQEQEAHIVDTLRKKQLSPKQPPKVKANEGGLPLPGTDIGPHYFLCMIGGGHFAAMVVALAPKTGKKHTGLDERSATVIAHKTFHRYTTRRKQGGSQSANDNAKGNAHSAGSSIRRYNETALINEVRELLSSWKSMIDTAELIFVRATGATNRRTLFGPYEGQVLNQKDLRNRGFPFSTRRATQKELMRAFIELTRVKQSTIDEVALAALNAPQNDTSAVTPGPAKPKPQKPTKEEEAAALHTSQIVPLIKRSKVPALLNYLKTNSIPSTFTFLPSNYHTPTPLHLGASLNSAPIILALLTKAGADPTLRNDDARTPFALAGDRATRDAFRVARAELGESAWDWETAEVPAAMSKAEAEKRDAQEKTEKAAENQAESERRKAETERVRKESEAEEAKKRDQRLGKGKSLGALPVKTGADLREEEMRGLTPEARARMERERRARAAEERFKRMRG
ncbi:ankyrin repeat and zinc finger domain-containing protein 1 [Decorospora gaudefroyi]|uniref:Ankyrin repeat and zinc finger domain-containing protein 1 n=1 Tax=Decorospora gaudefroyi TaxID=184978 RepID=A0A6A5KDM9_9PLEO|nr:ankyrin repeat and zinc finger domain-containing protein 1 [Decorospora gaudefroyi]